MTPPAGPAQDDAAHVPAGAGTRVSAGAASHTAGDAPADVTAVVLCGGTSRRFGSDKLSQRLGTTTVLDALLTSLPAGWPIVAVGRRMPTSRTVTWTVESPPGGGPVAAVGAALAHVRTSVVVVLAGDMPFAGPAAVRLVEALTGRPDAEGEGPGVDAHHLDEAVVACDEQGRANPLLAAYRTEPLSAAMPAEPEGVPARHLLSVLRHALLEVPERESLDVDTPDALERARRRVAP